MCGRYVPLTERQLLEVIDALASEASWADLGRDGVWDARPRSVYPGDEGQLILPGLEVATKRWGYEVSRPRDLIFNTRIESALKGGMWTDSIAHRRCVVPCRAFFEPHRLERVASPRTGRPIKRQYEFWSEGSAATLLAGVWQGDFYSIVTCAPNQWMAPIHDRMPLVLAPSEVDRWFGSDYAELADRSGAVLASEPEDGAAQGAIQPTLF